MKLETLNFGGMFTDARDLASCNLKLFELLYTYKGVLSPPVNLCGIDCKLLFSYTLE